MNRRPNYSIKPEEITVTYYCTILKKTKLVKLSDLTFRGYGCSVWSCDNCSGDDSGVEINVYCECKKTHIIQEF